MLFGFFLILLVVMIGVKLAEAVWMVDDVLHDAQASLDLSLQIGVHEESHNETGRKQEETVWWDDFPAFSEHLIEYESQHCDLNDSQSDSSLEHGFSISHRKLDASGV